MFIAILGRQPEIGLAELESVLGSQYITMLGKTSALINTKEIQYSRFGSVIKFAAHKAKFSAASQHNIQKILLNTITNIYPVSSGAKLKIGLSFYEDNIRPSQINSMGLSIKKALKNKGYSIRIIPNNATALTSAQVIHNNLTGQSGLELIIIKDGSNYVLGTTVYEQDIEAYAKRDQARPKRDSRVGMLPPKLAQTIINLAVGQFGDWEIGNGKWENMTTPLPSTQPPTPILLDCFCGTGVILQEALLMGFDVYGTDLDPRMISYSKVNLEWLNTKYNNLGKVTLNVGDATFCQWDPIPKFIAAETYLGRPLSSLPKPDDLNKIIQDVNTLHKKVLANIHKQLPSGSRLCLAVPAWQIGPGRFKSLPVLDQLDKIGYNQLEFKNINAKHLVYARADQIVGRQLIVLVKY